MPRTRPLLLVLLVSALSWLGATGTAQAHTGLSSSSPAEGSTVTEALTALTAVTPTAGGAVRSPGTTEPGPVPPSSAAPTSAPLREGGAGLPEDGPNLLVRGVPVLVVLGIGVGGWLLLRRRRAARP